MSPGGHLVTTAVACAATLYTTGSTALAAAVGVGGFLIDVDHAIDYVLFERQRDLRPGAFLRYYVEGRIERAVLVLHSYELFAALIALAWWTQSALLSAYLVGALMHLGLDLIFNGRITPYSIAAFYSFGYRLAHRFEARALLGLSPHAIPGGFWLTFFRGTPPLRPLSRAPARHVGATTPDALAYGSGKLALAEAADSVRD
jgi:hypothetical protein